jgi:hypothetical protein
LITSDPQRRKQALEVRPHSVLIACGPWAFLPMGSASLEITVTPQMWKQRLSEDEGQVQVYELSSGQQCR